MTFFHMVDWRGRLLAFPTSYSPANLDMTRKVAILEERDLRPAVWVDFRYGLAQTPWIWHQKTTKCFRQFGIPGFDQVRRLRNWRVTHGFCVFDFG